jgi:hypothetical protein
VICEMLRRRRSMVSSEMLRRGRVFFCSTSWTTTPW